MTTPQCTCDPAVTSGGTIHHDWCETQHPNHPCDARVCQFAKEGASNV